MSEQTCLNCQWFNALPNWDAEMASKLGFYGECRRYARKNWSDTWASYWCGEWDERKRGPAILHHIEPIKD